MPLFAGDKLGPYELLSPIGAGGMGEVYKARDTRLDRIVAIKVLPEHIAQREDLRTRFEREARTVASLNHPHICVLYDIGNQDGLRGYMVMEYLEGETLETRIEKGALPLDGALRYATQIADALDRAHRAGVTHRDIKPGNIILTRDGVKVLDFGLAKSIAKPGPADVTIVKSLTTEGTVLGTPQYMSPEQFEGKEADTRSDIWGFGAVLYEMATGQKAFQGKSYSSLVGAILSADPPPMSVKPFTPAWLERLVRRCLAKEPDDRYQSMRDVVLDLRTPIPEAIAPSPKQTRWLWAATAVALGLGLLAGGRWLGRTELPAAPITLELNLPESALNPTISPDGRTVAFAARSANGVSMLFLRSLESLEARPVTGTEGASQHPFWSPDSRSLGFEAGGKLKRIDLATGVAVALCDVFSFRGGSWNTGGVILVADLEVGGIRKVMASGGTATPVTQVRPEAGERRHHFPQFLPGGKKFLYFVRGVDSDKSGIAIGSLAGTPPVRIQPAEFSGAYDEASGSLLFTQGQGTLMAQPMELDPPRLTGEPAPVAEGIRLSTGSGRAEFSVSRNGTLLYARAVTPGKARFAWRDRSGNLVDQVGQPFEPSSEIFDLSPDNTRVAYISGSTVGSGVMRVMDLKTGVSTQLTTRSAVGPLWSADGKQIFYNSGNRVYRKAADGSGEEQIVAEGNYIAQSISPDSKFLLYGSGDLLLLPLTGDRKPRAYLQTKYREYGASFSPDGRWVAYPSNESGSAEVYIQGFPDLRGKWPASTEGGSWPRWRADGKELFWIQGDTVMAASIELQAASVRIGRAERLFARGLQTRVNVTHDGRRFLELEPEGGVRRAPPLVIQLNWAARMRR